jgi:hypothetical protein
MAPIVPSKIGWNFNVILNPGKMSAINFAIMELAIWPPNQHYRSTIDAPGNTLPSRSRHFLTRV